MTTNASGGAIHGIVHQLCPRCRIGRIFRFSIFRGFPAMRETCLVCGLKFEREEGYFLGAMMIDYALGLAIAAAIGGVVWYFTHWPLDKTALVAFLVFFRLFPLSRASAGYFGYTSIRRLNLLTTSHARLEFRFTAPSLQHCAGKRVQPFAYSVGSKQAKRLCLQSKSIGDQLASNLDRAFCSQLNAGITF